MANHGENVGMDLESEHPYKVSHGHERRYSRTHHDERCQDGDEEATKERDFSNPPSRSGRPAVRERPLSRNFSIRPDLGHSDELEAMR